MTETWNPDIPVVAHDVTDDVVQIEQNLDYLIHRFGYVVSQKNSGGTIQDQGGTGTAANPTIKYIVDNLLSSATAYAVLFFPHHMKDGATTQYKLDTDEDLSANTNLYFYFQPGAYLDQVTGDEVLTVYSPENIISPSRAKIADGDILNFASPGTLYPEWWGALPDGSTDNSTAIQACYDCAEATAGPSDADGCMLQFGGGKYNFGTKITVQASGIITRGLGSGGWQTSDIGRRKSPTILDYTGTDAALECGDGTNVYTSIRFEGFSLDLSAATSATIGIHYLTLCHTHCDVKDVKVEATGATHATDTTWLGKGIVYEDRGQHNAVQSCGFFYLDYGVIAVELCDSLEVSRCKFVRMDEVGVALGESGATGEAGYSVQIFSNQFSMCDIGVYAARICRGLNIVNNYFECVHAASDLAIKLGAATPKATETVRITGNIFGGATVATNAIELVATDETTISGNEHHNFGTNFIYNSGTTANDGIRIINNNRTSGTQVDIDDYTGVCEWNQFTSSNPRNNLRCLSGGWIDGPQTVTSSSNSVTVNPLLGLIFYHVLTENTTFANPGNLQDGQVYKFIIKQEDGNSFTVTWDTKFALSGDEFTMTDCAATGADYFDALEFVYNATEVKLIQIPSKQLALANYTITNDNADRALDCNAVDDDADVAALKVTIAEIADVLGTLINDLILRGILK